MARPTKLTPELIEKAKTYLPTCHATPIETEKGGISYVDVKLPKLVDLALLLQINKDTITEWCKGTDDLSQEFSVIVKEIQQEQEKMLIDKGLGGLFQPKTLGMILSKHGYADRIEQDVTSGGEKIVMTPEKLALTQEFENKLKEQL